MHLYLSLYAQLTEFSAPLQVWYEQPWVSSIIQEVMWNHTIISAHPLFCFVFLKRRFSLKECSAVVGVWSHRVRSFLQQEAKVQVEVVVRDLI